MPTDRADMTVEIQAPLDRVLKTVRDVESQPDWIPEIHEAELLEVFTETGLPAVARFTAAAPVGSDEYTLIYDHEDEAMSWTLLEGRLQTGQEGRFVLTRLSPDRTRVMYELTISHHLPLPAFARQRVIRGLVANTTKGLKGYLEN